MGGSTDESSRTSRPPRRWLLGVAVAVVVAVAAWFVLVWSVQPSKPGAVYTPPTTLPDGPPGTIIRSEPIDGAASGQRVWRVLYTSRTEAGAPIAVSGVIVAPDATPPAGGWPVVAWAHGTTGVASRCAPSLEHDGGVSLVPEIDTLVDAGVVVAITDYQGLGTPGPHPYLVSGSEGRGVLDSVRAARSLLGADASATTAIFGHSQGGHATLAAADLAAAYAPELHLVGAAAMAPPTDLGPLLARDVGSVNGIVLTALALGAWHDYYADADLHLLVSPADQHFVDDADRNCIESSAQSLADLVDIGALKVSFLTADPQTVPIWNAHLQANSPTSVPAGLPILVSQGLKDDLVRPDVTEAFVAGACAAGASIELDTYAAASHFDLRTKYASPRVVAWLLDRLHGTPAAPGCSTLPQS